MSAGLSPAHAAVLGAVQGPTELLPVSSSAHVELVPWFLGWPWDELDAEERKAFEVAVHGGGALALVIARRREIARELRRFDARRAGVVVLSFAVPAVAGLLWERPIERHLGTPRAIAGGLAAGGVALALADRAPRERGPGDAGALDGLLLGLAQAAALMPGVSRSGATLTAARARRFDRPQASMLSRTVALPVFVGAGALKGARLARRGIRAREKRSLAVGAGVAFASTLASQPLISLVERGRLWPYAAYRLVLAGAILARYGT